MQAARPEAEKTAGMQLGSASLRRSALRRSADDCGPQGGMIAVTGTGRLVGGATQKPPSSDRELDLSGYGVAPRQRPTRSEWRVRRGRQRRAAHSRGESARGMREPVVKPLVTRSEDRVHDAHVRCTAASEASSEQGHPPKRAIDKIRIVPGGRGTVWSRMRTAIDKSVRANCWVSKKRRESDTPHISCCICVSP
jgi:hypothetical protein